jgi:hypothetical protein
MVCVGSPLPLDLEITNRGSYKFKVDKFEIGSSFTYGFFGDRESGRGGGMGIGCGECSPDFVSIDPDGTYKSSFNFDLTNDFFKDAGKYVIRTRVEGVDSNQLEFELFSCE